MGCQGSRQFAIGLPPPAPLMGPSTAVRGAAPGLGPGPQSPPALASSRSFSSLPQQFPVGPNSSPSLQGRGGGGPGSMVLSSMGSAAGSTARLSHPPPSKNGVNTKAVASSPLSASPGVNEAALGSSRRNSATPIVVHERSQSFTTAVVPETGQTVPAVATIEKSYSFTRVAPGASAQQGGGADASPPPAPASKAEVEAVRNALQKQAPWAAVFTPEEWARTREQMSGQDAGQSTMPPVTLLQLQK